MGNLKKNLLDKPHLVVGIFFAVLFTIGLNVFRDYGVHCDEYNNQHFGRRWSDYSSSVMRTRSLAARLPNYIGHDLCHGPVFEICLISLADFLKVSSSRGILLIRHFAVFLLFYLGVIFFYFFCLRIFQGWKLALLGCIFLVLSPRIFADAFYNSVDIAFLVFFLIGTRTLLWMLDCLTVRSTVAHAFVCALLFNVRPLGIFLPALTVPFLLFEIIRACSAPGRRQGVTALAGFILLFIFFGLALNPFLWTAPWTHLQEMIKYLGTFRFEGRVRYFGADQFPKELPFHYAPVWILVSTPLLYGLLFFTGIFAAIKSLLRKTSGISLGRRNIAIFSICFFLPILMAAGKLYDGWRHLYFIYPVFLIFVLLGVHFLWENIRPMVRVVLAIGIILSLADIAGFMIRNHPYQNLYFNRLAGANAGEITDRFELDYWGLSYRKAIEYILKTDQDAVISVCFHSKFLGKNNMKILSPEERKRLVSAPAGKAKYYLTNRMADPSPFSGEEYYSVKIDGLKIMAVYKLDHHGKK